MKRWIYAGIAALLTCASSTGHAEWDPTLLEIENTSILSQPKYRKMKQSVLSDLKGSWCSGEKAHLIMDLIALTQPKICVEIGAGTGASTLPIASALHFLGKGKVYAIDAWSNDIATRFWEDTDPNKPWWSSVDMLALKEMFDQRILQRKLEKHCHAIVLPSEAAVTRMPDIDFLHLDGDYSEKGSLQDVELYLPKVKPNGFILLSNLFIMVNGKQPKLKSFSRLLEECEIICEIEQDNAILFKKLPD